MDVGRFRRFSLHGRLLIALLAAFLPHALLAADPEPQEEGDPPASLFEERVEVSAARLPGPPSTADDQPAHVTVIEREEILRSGANTLQDLLALEAGAIVYDQVGNDIEKTFDLRGFTAGTGTRVYLDGAPVNDPRNNQLSLDLLPLAALERIEITRGSAAALAGGGAEAGVIHLRTRQGDQLGGSIGAAAGTFDTTRLNGSVHGGSGRYNFFLSAMDETTDGFRDNAGGDRTQWSGTGGVDLGGDRRLELSLLHSTSDLGNPGALTQDELAMNPEATPFNSLDYADRTLSQASLNFRGTLAGPFTIAANVMAQDREDALLTTGRSASLFGGFFAELDAGASGATVQVTHNLRSAATENHLTFGVEYLDGETDALGVFTPTDGLDNVDLSNPASLNTAERRTLSLFVQDSWKPIARLHLTAGVRFDDDDVGYREMIPTPARTVDRSFDEVSLRAGASWQAASRIGVYVSYGEAFLPPTAEQLFAFPLFGSNENLEPEDSASYEVGVSGRFGMESELRVAVLRVDTEDEIVFDPDGGGMFGREVNAGRTRREGLEASLRMRPTESLGVFANVTLIDAEFRSGADRGNEVPLVPGERFAVGADADLPLGLALRGDLLHVGDQVLDGDDSNEREKLDAYTLVNLRLTWSAARTRHAEGGARGLSLFAEARNALDEEYATRGITSFGTDFFTPAPGRRYLLGARWDF